MIYSYYKLQAFFIGIMGGFEKKGIDKIDKKTETENKKELLKELIKLNLEIENFKLSYTWNYIDNLDGFIFNQEKEQQKIKYMQEVLNDLINNYNEKYGNIVNYTYYSNLAEHKVKQVEGIKALDLTKIWRLINVIYNILFYNIYIDFYVLWIKVKKFFKKVLTNDIRYVKI